MNWKRILTGAAALACCLNLLPALGASALQPDLAEVQQLEMENSGYLALSQSELVIEIPSDESSVTEYLSIAYAEDNYNWVQWSSSDTHVVTVDNGAVTAWGQGSAVVTAWTDTGASGSCEVTVLKQKSSRLNRSLVELSIEYNVPQPRYQLYLQTDGGYDSIYQWRSNNPNVATVDRNGVVTGLSEGNATIYASTVRGTTLSCKVIVENDVGRVTLNEYRLYLESMGAQGVLVPTIAVEDPSQVGVTWTSNNPAVATVDAGGVVTAVGEGEAVITATTSLGTSESCKVYTGALGTQKRKEAESFFGLGGLFQDLFD